MAKIRHYTDGQLLGVPRNWQELEITFNWLDNKDEGAINTTQLEFVGAQKRYIKERLMGGLTGGVGIFEGIPYKIEVGEIGNPKFIFDGYIDGSAETTFLGDEEIIAPIKKVAGDDWLNDVADSFSFAYLASIGEIKNSDYKRVPYVINYVPDNMQMIMLNMSLYLMTKELIENIESLSKAAGNVVDAATPVLGVSVGLGAGVVTAWDIGNLILVTILFVARVAYIIAIIIAIKKLIEQLLEQIFPKMRYHLGMTWYDLFNFGCKHLGLSFESDLMSELKNDVYLPQKDKKGGSSGETGHPSNTDPIYTFGDLIRVAKLTYNADYKITDGVLKFERKDYWQQNSGLVLPDIFNNQERLLKQSVPNTLEFVANYNINLGYDIQDQNTLDDTTGLVFQAITKPVVVINKKLVNMKGLTEISIPYALGKRKDGFTDLEKFAREVLKVVDNLTGIFGGGTNFASKIDSRIGAMLLSSHFLSVGKMVRMNGGKLALNQRQILGAEILWEKYHFINSFAEIKGIHNQWYKMPQLRIPIKEDDLIKILENNFLTSPEGKRAMIEVLKWNPEKGTAVIDYRINEKYTNNLKIEYVR